MPSTWGTAYGVQSPVYPSMTRPLDSARARDANQTEQLCTKCLYGGALGFFFFTCWGYNEIEYSLLIGHLATRETHVAVLMSKSGRRLTYK
jgi:hypothetical protein